MNNDNQEHITLGYIRLTDAAPYVIAKEHKIFEKYGLDVKLEAQNSWATLRDKLEAGLLDAAQMLAPMPLASALGVGGSRSDIITPLITSQNGNAITLSSDLCNQISQHSSLKELPQPMPATLLKQEVIRRKKHSDSPITIATVFPHSCQYLQLVDYLNDGGIELDELNIVFLPPTHMVAAMSRGEIDGYCVGAPYNALGVREDIGQTIITSFDIWQDKAEKVLAFSENTYKHKEKALLKLVAAVFEACQWLAPIPHRFEAARKLSWPQYLDMSIDVIAPSLLGSCLVNRYSDPRIIPNYNRFNKSDGHFVNDDYEFNKPTAEHGQWILNKLVSTFPQYELAKQDVNIKQCYRSDIFERAMAELKN